MWYLIRYLIALVLSLPTIPFLLAAAFVCQGWSGLSEESGRVWRDLRASLKAWWDEVPPL